MRIRSSWSEDLFLPDTWVGEILAEAGIETGRLADLSDAEKQTLDALVPIAYFADTVEDRVMAYAEDMARKVRRSYPTHVVCRLMETDDRLKLPAAHNATVALLKRAIEQGFRLGETPTAAFLNTHPELLEVTRAPDAPAAKQQLHRCSSRPPY